MNYAVVAKALGGILMILGAAMLACFGLGWVEEWLADIEGAAAIGLLFGGLLTFSVGVALRLFGRRGDALPLRKEAILIVGGGWILAGAFGAIPYLFGVMALNPLQAYFESISGFTTTGSTVIGDLSVYPRSLLVWRSLTQWLGGAGILVLFVALLYRSGTGSKSLFRQESSSREGDSFQARTRVVAWTLWRLYLVLSLVCFVGLWVLGGDYYLALTHTMTTVSTGGFSPFNNSVSGFENPLIEWWIVIFMAFGGVSFMLMAFLLNRKWQRWVSDEETKVYLVLLLVATLVVSADLLWFIDGIGVPEALRSAAFQVVSIMTTTGFVTRDYDQWPAFAQVILVLLMFTGGCAGSTSGGIKVGRFVLLFKVTLQEIRKTIRPQQVFPLSLNGQTVSNSLVLQTLIFFALNGLLIAFGTLFISLMEPHMDAKDSFMSIVATLFNIGPGLGAVGAVQNFAHLDGSSLLVLSFYMLLGRLELFAILALLVPGLWRKY